MQRQNSSHKYTSVQEAKRKIEGYCAYQDRCHKEVQQKLLDMRMIPEAIDQIMAHLIQENYLNEERFAKSFARGKFSIKKVGKESHCERIETTPNFNIQYKERIKGNRRRRLP